MTPSGYISWWDFKQTALLTRERKPRVVWQGFSTKLNFSRSLDTDGTPYHCCVCFAGHSYPVVTEPVSPSCTALCQKRLPISQVTFARVALADSKEPIRLRVPGSPKDRRF